MKNTIIVFSLLMFMSSCKMMSLINNQQLEFKSSTATVGSKGALILDVTIDDKKMPLMFDTGATISFINNDSVISENSPNLVKFGTVETPDGKKHDKMLAAVKLETPWFDSPNKVVGILPAQKFPCSQKSNYYGVIGIDAFIDQNVILGLNFERSEITTVVQKDIIWHLFDGYEKIKSTIEKRQIFIYPEINGKEYKMLFDSGNSSTLIIPYNEQLISELDQNDIVIDGVVAQSVTATFGSETIILNASDVKVGGTKLKLSAMMMKGLSISNAGFTFMKHFSWLIDFRTGEVWMRRNSIQNESAEIKIINNYVSMIQNNEIIIASKIRGKNLYNVGDVILAVDGLTVTSENICELQKKLTSTNWDSLKIVTK